MAEQLDVFLGPETIPFLDKLFIAIQTEEYLKEILPVDGEVASGILLAAEKENDDILLMNANDPMLLKGTHENTPPIEVCFIFRFQ